MSSEPLYYIQDTRSFTGNSVQWWRENGHGYTTNLKDAWRVTAERAQSITNSRGTDVAWPCDDIDAGALTHFDMQNLRNLKPLERAKTNG